MGTPCPDIPQYTLQHDRLYYEYHTSEINMQLACKANASVSVQEIRNKSCMYAYATNQAWV